MSDTVYLPDYLFAALKQIVERAGDKIYAMFSDRTPSTARRFVTHLRNYGLATNEKWTANGRVWPTERGRFMVAHPEVVIPGTRGMAKGTPINLDADPHIKYHGKNLLEAPCNHCGKPFLAPKKNRHSYSYCSNPCRKAAIAARKIVTEGDFWSRVQIGGLDQCWPWLGAANAQGWEYGRVCYRGKRMLTNRLAFELSRNRPLIHNALHTCDNPKCCNPVHLYDGTHADNNLDCVKRGRNKQFKLNEEKVRLIRSSDAPAESLAEQFGVTSFAIKCARAGRTWRHVT